MKRLISSTFLAGAGVFALAVTSQPAMAMNLPGPIKIDGGPLGQLEVSGGLSAQLDTLSGMGTNSYLGDGTSSGARFRTIDLSISKTSGPLQFTVEVKPSNSLYLGYAPGHISANTFTTGPLYLGYVTLAPSSNFSISVGQVGSVEGWESSTDWNNANIVDSPLYYVENSSSRGVSANFSYGPLSGTLVFGDGWDSGVFNTMQALVTYTFNSNNALSLYGEANFGTTGPGAYAYGQGTSGYGPDSAYYENSNMIGGYYDFTYGNLNVVPEVQYVYAKVNHKIGLDKFSSNFGAEVITDYQFGKTPWSVGSQVFYYSNNGPSPFYLNPGSAGIGIGVTPSYAKGSFFARGEVAMLHLTNIGVPGSVAFGSDGTNRNTVLAVLEGGFVF